MPDFDLLIRGAHPHPAIGIADGKIAAFVDGSAAAEIDASGLLVLPGVIDAHVHFNEPGRTHWEGVATGSRACAVGGTTTFFDMPLNAHPPTCDPTAFAEKRRAFEGAAHTDFALWGGLVPGNLADLAALGECGVVGLKAFMCPSGVDDFASVDPATLRVGMQRAAEHRLIVAVHAEIEKKQPAQGRGIRDYLASRPIEIECEAIRIALELAGETGCALHVVHISSATGVALVAAARARGQDVTGETCPHYLTLNEADLERLGAVAKCAPPLRSEHERRQLLAAYFSGLIQSVGSDHSPAPMDMKTDPDFFRVWGGISGCQHLLSLLFDLGTDLELLAKTTATHLAARFHLSQKGRLAVGADADLVLLDPASSTAITAEALHYRHRHTPYLGRTLRGEIARVLLRGETIALAGAPVGPPRGKLVRPDFP